MLKGILVSLKNSKGIESNKLKASGFDYLIKNSDVFLMYSLKFELSTIDFQYYIADFIDNIKSDRDFYNTVLDICIKWYEYFLESKTLFKSTSSLKSELKKVFKKHTGGLNRFDRFFEKIYNAFMEAYNIYDIAFYNATAITRNQDFAPDRDSCYITSQEDYLQALKQANSYYVVIYRNEKPITRVWFLTDKDYEYAAVFNSYGFRFIDISKLFGNQDELKAGSSKNLQKAIKVYVNNDTVMISSNTTDYDSFIYKLLCPTCKGVIRSNEMMLRYDEEYEEHRLKCPHCSPVVYSEFYKDYINEEDAIYSDYLETYLYESDSVYSNYLDSFIYRYDAVKVYNADTDEMDWVPESMALYCGQKGKYLIKDQTIYSEYEESYILKNETVYSKFLRSYITDDEDDYIQINNDYFPIPKFTILQFGLL